MYLGDGLRNIGEDWFRGSALEDIIIPSNIRVIERAAFCECLRLKSVIFQGNGPDIIQDSAFAYSGLESFTAPASLQRIGEMAFAECKDLKHADFS